MVVPGCIKDATGLYRLNTVIQRIYSRDLIVVVFWFVVCVCFDLGRITDADITVINICGVRR